MTIFPVTNFNTNPKGKHEYKFALFVDRTDELNVVRKVVESIQEQLTPVNPVVNFWGVTGIGKTWLLRRLEEKYRFPCREVVSFTAYHSFEGEMDDPLPALTRVVADAISQQLESLLSREELEQLEEAAVRADTKVLVSLIRALANRIVPVLLFDSTESLTSDGWAAVERKVIEPLAQHGRVIIVIAGRRYSNWYRFEARRRAKTQRVKEFNQAQVQELLKRYDLEIDASIIYPLTAGTPYLVRDIADFAGGAESGAVLGNNWVEKLRPHLLEILTKFEDRFLDNIDVKLRPFLLAIVPLRVYRLDAFTKMTAGIERTSGVGNDLTLLRELAATEAAWWDSARKAYTTDPVGRCILDRKLLLEDQAIYRAKHKRALGIYQASAEEFPSNSEDFILESWFHLASLYAADQDEDAFLRGYEEIRGIEAWLDYAENHLRPDGLMTLYQEFSPQGDTELFDLIPQHLRDKILERLSRLALPEA